MRVELELAPFHLAHLKNSGIKITLPMDEKKLRDVIYCLGSCHHLHAISYSSPCKLPRSYKEYDLLRLNKLVAGHTLNAAAIEKMAVENEIRYKF